MLKRSVTKRILRLKKQRDSKRITCSVYQDKIEQQPDNRQQAVGGLFNRLEGHSKNQRQEQDKIKEEIRCKLGEGGTP